MREKFAMGGGGGTERMRVECVAVFACVVNVFLLSQRRIVVITAVSADGCAYTELVC